MAHPAVRVVGTVARAVLPNSGRVGAFASDNSRRFTAGVDYSSSASRVVGTVYTNGPRRRHVNVAIGLTSGQVASYTTTVGGTTVTNKQFGGFTISGTSTLGGTLTITQNLVQNCTFFVDPGASYSVTSAGTKATWVEVDW